MAEVEIELIEDENLWVFGPDQLLNVEYTVGSFQVPDRGENSVALILLTKFADKFLVCVPHKCWHKKATSRILPADFLEKPISVEVAACLGDNRDEPQPGSVCKVWVGWLNKKFPKLLDFEDSSVPAFVFTLQDSGDECFPYADSLQAVAMEKFHVNFGQPAVAASESARLAAVEAQLGEMKEGLDALLKFHIGGAKPGGSGYHSALEEVEKPVLPPGLPYPTSKASAAPPAKVGAGPKKAAYPGLDPSTVSAALQAGVPPEHLRQMSSLVQKKPLKLGELPRNARQDTAAGRCSWRRPRRPRCRRSSGPSRPSFRSGAASFGAVDAPDVRHACSEEGAFKLGGDFGCSRTWFSVFRWQRSCREEACEGDRGFEESSEERSEGDLWIHRSPNGRRLWIAKPLAQHWCQRFDSASLGGAPLTHTTLHPHCEMGLGCVGYSRLSSGFSSGGSPCKGGHHGCSSRTRVPSTEAIFFWPKSFRWNHQLRWPHSNSISSPMPRSFSLQD